MTDDITMRTFTTPSDVRDFFFEKLCACGCSDLSSMMEVVRDLLEWTDKEEKKDNYFDTLFNGNEGVYYLLAGLLDRANLTEHGVSIRFPFLTELGKSLLKALREIPFEEIEDAYNGPD